VHYAAVVRGEPVTYDVLVLLALVLLYNATEAGIVAVPDGK